MYNRKYYGCGIPENFFTEDQTIPHPANLIYHDDFGIVDKKLKGSWEQKPKKNRKNSNEKQTLTNKWGSKRL